MSDTQIQDAAAAAAAAAASKATNIGAATAVGAGFLANNWIGIAGLIIGLAGFGVNWYFKLKEDRRREAEHAARLDS